MPYVPFDPNKPLTTATPASPATPKSGYVPFDPNAQAGGAQPQPTSGASPSPDPGWGIDWSKRGGDITMPQSVTDWGNIAGNEAMAGTIPGLRMAAQEAQKRLDPVTAGSADMAGGALSPTNLFYGVPYAGPGLAGGLHEGIKSYEQGNDWSTIGKDAAAGVAAGYAGQGVAKVAPYVLPQLARGAVDLGPAAAMTYAAHKVFGDPSKDILGALGGYTLMHNLSEGAGEASKKLAASPYTQQAIKSLILGGTAAARGNGPDSIWDQVQGR
jgi:hypothetical protein